MTVRQVMFHFEDQHPVDEIEKVIEDQTYFLVPDAVSGTINYYQNKQKYDQLDQLSQTMFSRKDMVRQSQLTEQHHSCVRHVLPADLCKMLIKQADETPAAIAHPNLIKSLLPLILREDIDQQLCSYFNSEYSLMCYCHLPSHLNEDTPPYSANWHCDGGPRKHLKMLIYLNGYQEHLGNTRFLDWDTTNKLKQTGFIFANVATRAADIGPLCRSENIELNEIMYGDIGAGDALLFNPNQLAHVRKKPQLTTRHVLQLCFVQSPYHWQHSHQHMLPPNNQMIGFEGIAQKMLDFVKPNQQSQSNTLAIPASGDIVAPAQLKLLIGNIFSNAEFVDNMSERLLELDPKLQQLNNITALLDTLKQSFKDSINWQGELGTDNIANLVQLAQYEAQVKNSMSRYAYAGKPMPEAVSWPNPAHPDKPLSKYDLMPYVKKYPIMDADTPIGSAGSCFAFEIARVLQQANFNYVVTERNDDLSSGIIVDGYTPGDKYARFCANYGILFNSPSFKQLAQRAFAIKPTQKLLFQQSDGLWLDPYRENVMFADVGAYDRDHQHHLDASRAALEQCEVFIVTLGLNECWQFRDGSYMSRNPRFNMYTLVEHRTLTVQQNVDNIQAFFDIVKQHNPKFKLIISVSPIPFLATGRADEHHIITANNHSKAVLRVAAEQLVASNADMYYLPSYEMVTECIKDPWQADDRHVKPATVEKVVELFKQMFGK